MKEKLAIIGANEAITMLIQKAKDLGYETHVFAWQCGDPGEKAADHFYPISIDEKEKIAEKCREIGIAGVCSITSDYAAPTVNYVARSLGLTHNPEQTEKVARNKYLMRVAFKKAGLYTPPFQKLDGHYPEESVKEIRYPVIVKPTDRWSSKGVTCVKDPANLRRAVEEACELSFDHQAIVEGFMDGPEYSAECICFQGKKTVLAFTQKQTTGYPHYIETGHVQPAPLTDEQKERAERAVKKGLEALSIQNGAAHVEFRILLNGEIGIIEIGARMGGDTIGTDLTPRSTGMDYIKMVIDVACGKEPDLSVKTAPVPVTVRFIMDPSDVKAFENIQKTRPDDLFRVSKFDDTFSTPVVDSNTRHGYYIMKAAGEDRAF